MLRCATNKFRFCFLVTSIVIAASILFKENTISASAADWIGSVKSTGDITFNDSSLTITANTPFDISFYQKRLLRHYYKISIESDDMLGEVITISKDEDEILKLTGGENGKTRSISIRSRKIRGPTGQTIGDKLTAALGSSAECEVGGDDWFACWSKERPNIYYHPSCWNKIETGKNEIPPKCTIVEISIVLSD